MGKHSDVQWWEPAGRAEGQYRKQIGGRTFYLGADHAAALAQAAQIRQRWAELKGADCKMAEWPEGEPNRFAIQARVQTALGGSLASPFAGTAPTAPTVSRVAVGGVTVQQAANLYLSERKSENISPRTYDAIKHRLAKGIEAMGKERVLGTVGQAELKTLRAHFSNPKTCSALYGKHVVQAVKAFLSWASEHDQIRWQKPSGFDGILVIETERPRTEEEMEALKAKILNGSDRYFTLPQLQALFRQADPLTRAWLMLGLNCGYYPTDIAALKVSDLRNGGKRIETLRGKTLVPSKHDLWPETIAAVKAVQSDGKFLFERSGGRRHTRTTISQAYAKLRKAAAPDAPDFKFLRHTSGNEIKKIAGGEVSEVHLAHTESLKMQGPYTDRLWDHHAKAMEKLRKVFAPVWR